MAKAKFSVAGMATELSKLKFDTSNYVSLSPISKLAGNTTKLVVLQRSEAKAKPKK